VDPLTLFQTQNNPGEQKARLSLRLDSDALQIDKELGSFNWLFWLRWGRHFNMFQAEWLEMPVCFETKGFFL